MSDWGVSKCWADKYLPEVERVIRSQAHQIVTISIASSEKDCRFATDYEVKIAGGDVACRIRDWSAWLHYGDITLRYTRPSGQETEVSKIKKGHGDWYLYAWAKNHQDFGAWLMVDLAKLRSTNLLDTARIHDNFDGSSQFISITLSDLLHSGCIAHVGGEAISRLVKAIEGVPV